MRHLTDDSPLEYPCEHGGKKLKDVPVSYLNYLWNEKDDLPKELERWLEFKEVELEEAGNFGEDATLRSVYED